MARDETGERDGAVAAVRPLNHVEDGPVIRRIGDRPLYLGNALAADPERHDRSFARVLSLCTDPRPLTTHHHPLDDGRGNDRTAFAAAVDAARELHRGDGSVLVHCTAGVSRSSAVLATALAAEEDRPFRGALGLVQRARPRAFPTRRSTSRPSCTWRRGGSGVGRG